MENHPKNHGTSAQSNLGEAIRDNNITNPDKTQVDGTTLEDNSPLEAQLGWIYVGHGEWVQLDPLDIEDKNVAVEQDPEWIRKWRINNDTDIAAHQEVREKGYPNRWGARRQVDSAWNLQALEQLLQDYGDKDIVEWIKYGWPTAGCPHYPLPCSAPRITKEQPSFPSNYNSILKKKQSMVRSWDPSIEYHSQTI